MAAALRPLTPLMALTPLMQPPKVVKAKKNFLLFLRYLREKNCIFAKIKNHYHVKNKNGIFLQGMRQ